MSPVGSDGKSIASAEKVATSEVDSGRGGGSSGNPSSVTPETLPPEAEKVLKNLVDTGGSKALLSVFGAFSRTSFGPDPEAAKILAEVEIKAEDNRLRAYEATLKNRDEQSKRDDNFRRKKLNHDSAMQAFLIVVCVVGLAIGGWLRSDHQQELGGYIMLASFTLLATSLGGKFNLPKPPQ